MARHRRKLITTALAVSYFTLVLLLTAMHVSATRYGSGPYGSCPYQTACTSTVVTVPSGPGSPASPLQVNINLKDGQVIPRSGYTIIVTPLNGRGSSFKQVAFYINGALVQTRAPDENGTASWFWNVGRYPGTVVKVVITGQAGQVVSRTFHVKLAPLVGGAAGAAAPPSVLQRIISAPKRLIQSIVQAIPKLPAPVKYGLPYLLFLLLGADVLLLLYRARHEAVEARRLDELIVRERQTRELKHVFVTLLTHYLRTPLTIISGGFELNGQAQAPAPAAVEAVRQCIVRLNTAIDSLALKFSQTAAQVVTFDTRPPVQPRSVWRLPNFYVPLLSIGVIVFCFDYLARHANGFSIGQINVIIQAALFGSLGFLVYHIARHHELSRQHTSATARVLAEETSFNGDRDRAIAFSATQIKDLADGLTALVAQLPTSTQAKKLLDNGTARLQTVLRRLFVANQLQGSRDTEPYSTVALGNITQAAMRPLETKRAAKAIRITLTHDLYFPAQNEALLTFVLQTILDNAIAFSPQGGEVLVDAAATKDGVSMTVTDHGTGVPADKQFSLFQAFSKAEGTETFNHDGMGFSLYLDKLIMHYLVGDITVAPEPNQGTKVTLTLPVRLQ